MSVTGSVPFPFVTKNGSLGSFKTLSAEQFNSDFGYGDVITGSYPLTASISSDFFDEGFFVGEERKKRLLSLKNTLNYYSTISPHYAFNSDLGNKESQKLRLLSIPSIFYGQSIKKGTVSCKWYLSGSLMAELADVRQNGELVQVYPSGSGFREIQKLTASGDADPVSDYFGESFAISPAGETLAVGAFGDEENGGDFAGAVYVFKKGIDGYRQVQKLTASGDANPTGDGFGEVVAVSPGGDIIAISARFDEEQASRAGSVYIFQSGSGGYQQVQKLLPDNVLNPQNDLFGSDLHFSAFNNTFVVGSPGVQNGLGRVYIYESGSGGFQQTQQIMASGPSASEVDSYGSRVVLSRDNQILFVGAEFDDDGAGKDPGSVYVFQSGSSGYQQVQRLTASGDVLAQVDESFFGRFGASIGSSLAGEVLAIGAPRDTENGGFDPEIISDTSVFAAAGAAYVFLSGSSGYYQIQKLTASGDAQPTGDHFGESIAVSRTGRLIAVGSYKDDENGGTSQFPNYAGSVYIFERGINGYKQIQKITAKNSISPAGDWLGYRTLRFSQTEDILYVGASGDEDNGLDSGAVYIFYNSSGYNKVAGSVLYNEGFILLTGSWSLHPTYTDKFNVNDTLVDYSPSWYYFMTTGSEGTNQVPSSSFSLNFEGIEKIPTLTMLAKAEVGEFNHSNNPTFIEYGQDASLVSSSNSLSEKSDLAIKNIVPSIYDEEDPPLEKITYISKVAIYDKEKNLIGVAKLANPVRKRQNDSLSLKLKLDL